MSLITILMMVLVGASFLVQSALKNTYGKWNEVANSSNMTGEQVARRMLDSAGLQNVPVKLVRGELTDHFNPVSNEVFLSESNFAVPSVAAMAVAAHEVGHAIQNKQRMPALVVRHRLAVPLSIGTNVAPYLFLAGMLLRIPELMWVGVIGFGGAMLFQLITLPVEFDASRRALNYIRENHLINSQEEISGAQSVLKMAALTYVIAFAMALANFLYYLDLATNRRE